jgi:hypothetical protein
MSRPSAARRHVPPPTARVAFAAVALMAAGAGCDRHVTAPRAPAEVSVVFLDNTHRLNTVRTGEEPLATGLRGVLPFAAANGKLAYFAPRVVDTIGGQRVLVDSGGLRLFDVATGVIDTLPIPLTRFNTPGAISPDGKSVVYARASNDSAWVVAIELSSGERDSTNLSARIDHPAAVTAIFSTPVFSPDGELVAFLLPNPIGMQLMIYEVRTRRVELFPIRVATTTRYAPLSGWPRWTPDGAIRFLVRERSTPQELTDTLAVLKIFPRVSDRPAVVAYRGRPSSDLTMRSVDVYSFDEGGTAVAFGMNANNRAGVFLMREGAGVFEEMVYTPGLSPTFPLLVP